MTGDDAASAGSPVRTSAVAAMAGPGEVAAVARIGLWTAIVCGVVFTLIPWLDPTVSAIFLNDNGGYALAVSPFWKSLRWIFLRGFTVWYVTIVIAGILAAHGRRPVLGMTWPKWLYMGLCAVVGPLLVTNLWLKGEWGRWRPREISGLGGTEEFTGPLDPFGSCQDNCSFVSGEVSSTVMVFVTLALVSGQWRPQLYWLAAAMSMISALIRIGQGGHFLSDTLFAAAFMLLIAAGIYRLMFLGSPPLATATDLDWPRLAGAHDKFFERVCKWGLAALDAIAPRR